MFSLFIRSVFPQMYANLSENPHTFDATMVWPALQNCRCQHMSIQQYKIIIATPCMFGRHWFHVDVVYMWLNQGEICVNNEFKYFLIRFSWILTNFERLNYSVKSEAFIATKKIISYTFGMICLMLLQLYVVSLWSVTHVWFCNHL